MTREKKILYGVAIAVIILLALQLRSLFSSNKPAITHEDLIAAKDETIKAVQGEREAWKVAAADKQRTIEQLKQKDSTLTVNFISNQKTYKPIDERLNNIPVYIDRIRNNDDSIRAAFAR